MKLATVALAALATPPTLVHSALSHLSPAAVIARDAWGLNSLMQDCGKLYFGSSTDVKYMNDSRYEAILADPVEFGQVTPENSQKFDATEPEQGVFNFTDADCVVDQALARNQRVRCHNLVWYNALPSWLTSQTWDNATLISLMENHIRTVVTHFKGRCYAWDVVNEALNDDGTLRETLWYTTIGPEYIALAYQFAAKYDPDAKLYYNDYGIEEVNNKSIAAANLIKNLKAQGVKIDGVGLQAHFPAMSAPDYTSLMQNLAQFTPLDIEVAYTELDVFIEMPDNATKMAQQSTVYTDTFRACRDTPECVGVTVWGFYDPYSWVWAAIPGFGDPDLWWANYTKKPVYDKVADVLRG